MRFDPGPGMGGHCLPIDPFYLAFKAREHDFYPEFIELAGKMNQAQPGFCVERVERALNDAGKPVKGSKILLLGVSYKAGVGDTRESPALVIARLLRELGGEVSYHDPHVPELDEFGLGSVELGPALAACDVAAIVTAHPSLDYALGGRGGASRRRLPRRHPRDQRREPDPALAASGPRQCAFLRRVRCSWRSTTWAISFFTLESPLALMWPVS